MNIFASAVAAIAIAASVEAQDAASTRTAEECRRRSDALDDSNPSVRSLDFDRLKENSCESLLSTLESASKDDLQISVTIADVNDFSECADKCVDEVGSSAPSLSKDGVTPEADGSLIGFAWACDSDTCFCVTLGEFSGASSDLVNLIEEEVGMSSNDLGIYCAVREAETALSNDNIVVGTFAGKLPDKTTDEIEVFETAVARRALRGGN